MNAQQQPDNGPGILFLPLRVAVVACFALGALFLCVVDMRSGPSFGGVSLLAGVAFALLPAQRMPSYFLHLLISLPLIWFASMVTLELSLPPRCSPYAVERNAAPLIWQLDEYRRVHGQYPETLAAAGITPPRYRCGTFRYERSSDDICRLAIGDYSRDWFTASWNSQKRRWNLDT